MNKLYACSFTYLNNTNQYRNIVSSCDAPLEMTEKELEEYILEQAKKEFPSPEYTEHKVAIVRIPLESILKCIP